MEEINFATADPQAIELEVVATVEKLLGRPLERADPVRIFLRGVELLIIQQRLLIDEVGKQNLLYYAKGDNLDHLGYLTGCERLPAVAATTTVELTLSTPRAQATTIKKGTRITAGDEVYFALDEAVVIPAAQSKARVKATCTQTGAKGNGYLPTELNRIVDPQPFLLAAVNVTTSEGGSDSEDDDHFRQRIRESVESFSVAGSEGAYIYHAKSVSALIEDVTVTSPVPGDVNVYVLLQDGNLPGEEMLAAVNEHLNKKTVRPLTDNVTVLAPDILNYDLTARYWIARSDAVLSAQIQEEAQAAVDEYQTWQAAKLGRDLNPTELIYRLKAAGVKRVEVVSPTFAVVADNAVAKAQNVNVTFAGLEED